MAINLTKATDVNNANAKENTTMENNKLNLVMETIRTMVATDTDVSTTVVRKQGDVELTGIIIREAGSIISPTIYVDKMLESDMTVKEIADKVMETYETHKVPDASQFGLADVSKFTDWEWAKDKLTYRLVNKETSTEWLEDKVWANYLDMALVPMIIPSEGATVTIKKEHANAWNKTETEVIAQASTNFIDKAEENVLVKDMFSMLSEAAPDVDFSDMLEDINNGPQMIIITNKEKTNGAAYAFLPTIINRVADTLDGDLYILPSSIHECIVMKQAEDMEIEYLRAMVKDVNNTQVIPEERLSYSVYKYTRETGKVEIAE